MPAVSVPMEGEGGSGDGAGLSGVQYEACVQRIPGERDETGAGLKDKVSVLLGGIVPNR